MSSPTKYELTYDFTGFQAVNPTTPLPADKLEIELNNIGSTTDEIITNLSMIQRSDGELHNKIVTLDSLSDDARELFGLDTVNIEIVSENIDDIITVADISGDIASVSSNISDIIIVSENIDDLSAMIDGAATARMQGTSTTSLLIEEASKVFVTQEDKFFDEGTFVIAVSAADVSNYMHGQVTDYTGTNLTVNVTSISGTGTFADWLLFVSGAKGAKGDTGDDGAPGDGTGDVVGPVSSVDGRIALFNGVTGKIIKQAAGGYGTMASQNSAGVDITGGTIVGITDLALADGGTGSSTAAGARTNLDVYSTSEVDDLLSGWTTTEVSPLSGDAVTLLSNISSAGYTEIIIDGYGINNSNDITDIALELGDSGGFETSGYKGYSSVNSGSTVTATASTANIMLYPSVGNADNSSFSARLRRKNTSTNVWAYETTFVSDLSGTMTGICHTCGYKETSATTTSLQIRRITSTGYFNSGTIIVKAR